MASQQFALGDDFVSHIKQGGACQHQGFGTPGAINAFLVAMLYFEPGSMRVEGAEQKLPAWLFPHYQQIFAQPLAA